MSLNPQFESFLLLYFTHNLFADSVSYRGRYKAVRFGESIVTARADPSDNLWNQFLCFTLLGIAGINVDRKRTAPIQRSIVLILLKQFDQALCSDQTVSGFDLQLQSDVFDDRLAGDFIKEYPSVPFTDDGDNGNDLCVREVLGVGTDYDLIIGAKLSCGIPELVHSFRNHVKTNDFPGSCAVHCFFPFRSANIVGTDLSWSGRVRTGGLVLPGHACFQLHYTP